MRVRVNPGSGVGAVDVGCVGVVHDMCRCAWCVLVAVVDVQAVCLFLDNNTRRCMKGLPVAPWPVSSPRR